MDLLKRIKAILATPETEWPLIVHEAGSASALLVRYVAILALIPALAHLIGATLVGWYTPILAGLVGALITYLASFVVVYVVALIIDVLAPVFGGRRDFARALKLAIYSATPVWLAGIFLLVPGLSFLMMMGFYGAYLLWVGLPILMQAPAPQALPYAAVTAGGALVIAIGLGVLETAWFSPPP